jgi:hypothetical protein
MQIKQLYSQSGNLKTPVKQKTDKDLKQVKIGDHTVSQIPGLAPGASKVFVFPVLSMAPTCIMTTVLPVPRTCREYQ